MGWGFIQVSYRGKTELIFHGTAVPTLYRFTGRSACWEAEPGSSTARAELDTGATFYDDSGLAGLDDPQAVCGTPSAPAPFISSTSAPTAGTIVAGLTLDPPSRCASASYMLSIAPLLPQAGSYQVRDCRSVGIGSAQAALWLFAIAGKPGVALIGFARVTWLGVPDAAHGFAGLAGDNACWHTPSGEAVSVDILTGALRLGPNQTCP